MSEHNAAGHQPPATDGSVQPDRTVSVDVDLTEPMLELVRRVKTPNESVEDYIVSSLVQRVRSAGLRSHTFDAHVDIPEPAAEFGRLRAEDARLRGKEDADERDYIVDHVDVRFNFPDQDDEAEQ